MEAASCIRAEYQTLVQTAAVLLDVEDKCYRWAFADDKLLDASVPHATAADNIGARHVNNLQKERAKQSKRHHLQHLRQPRPLMDVRDREARRKLALIGSP